MSSCSAYVADPCKTMWGDGAGHDEFASFMRFKPEHLFQDPRGSHSSSTKPPSVYDLHLGKSLVLKKVIFLEHLDTRLGEVVDKLLIELWEKDEILPYPSVNEVFPTKKVRKAVTAGLSPVVNYEPGVLHYYMKTTAEWCCTMASTMVLHPTFPYWMSALDCTPDPQSQSHGAIADLYLTISKKEIKKLPKEYRSVWLRVRRNFSKLMPFECKSLLAANHLVMRQIKLFGDGRTFPWKSCGDLASCSHTRKLSTATLGPDHQKVDQGLLSQELPPFDAFPWYSETVCPSPQLSATSGSQHDFIRDGSVESDQSLDHSRSPTPDPHPNGEGSTPERNKESARDILQQAWAQAVRIDSTFLAILAGNYEIIGIRHRATQTLYITDVISVDTHPCHKRLHTGLYISVLQDAYQRTVYMMDNHCPQYDQTKDSIPPSLDIDQGDSQGFAPIITPDDYVDRYIAEPIKPSKARSSTPTACIVPLKSLDAVAESGDEKTPRSTPTQLPPVKPEIGSSTPKPRLSTLPSLQSPRLSHHLRYLQTPPHTPHPHYQRSSSSTPLTSNDLSSDLELESFPIVASRAPGTAPYLTDTLGFSSFSQSSLSKPSGRVPKEKQPRANYSPYATGSTKKQPKKRNSKDVTQPISK